MKIPTITNWIAIATLLISVTCQLIDDFTTNTLNKNNLGGLRTGGLVNSDDPPGFRLHHSFHFLIESLGPSPFVSKDLSGLSLKITYTTPTAGDRTLVYLQANPLSLQTTASLAHVWFDKGHNLSVSIPLHLYFANANMMLGYAFKIGGPLLVHCLELITGSETGLTVPAIPDLQHTSVVLPSSEIVPDPHIHYQYNLNKLNKQRAGFGITLVNDGVEIAEGGVLNEYLGLQAYPIRIIRINYSSTVSCSMRIQIQYHRLKSTKYTQTFSSTVPISAGHMQTVNVPVNNFVLHDDVSIRILGQVIIHRIFLLKTSFLEKIVYCCLGKDDDIILVDDLSTWPLTNVNLVDKPQRTPSIQYHPLYRDIDNFDLYNNNLNQPCGARISSKTHAYQNGIHLNQHDRLFEHLAEYGHFIHLINANIDIQYSAQSSGSVDWHLLNVQENNDNQDLYFVQTLWNVEYRRARNGILRFHVNNTLVQSISIQANEGHPLIIHGIILRIPIPGSPNKYTQIVVDDFSRWQTPISPSPITTPTLKGISMFNYEHDPLYHAPSYNLVNLLPGTGIDILNNGWMRQDLYFSDQGQIVIRYSAKDIGTRQIKMTYWANSRMQSYCMHVVFNVGHYQHVYIPYIQLLQESEDPIYTVSVQVFGLLRIHQIEMLDASSPVPLPPSGHSFPNALLIDDFSNLSQIDTNALHYKRIVNCKLGNGSVTLHNHDQSLVEMFRNEASTLDMNKLFLRITYSVSCPLPLHISPCFSKPVIYFAIRGVDVHLHSGSMQVFNVPISKLMAKHKFPFPFVFHGFKVHGPQTKDCPLTIHRLEFTSGIIYSQPIQYKYSTLNAGLSIDYNEKLDYLYNHLTEIDRGQRYPLNINRDHVWMGALSLLNASISDLYQLLDVSFENELASGGGGPTREFFTVVASSINNLEHDLFTTSADTGNALEINANAVMQQDSNLRYYRCIGRIIGMAISQKQLMGITFSPFIYKRFLAEIGPLHSTADIPDLEEIDQKDVDIQDLEAIDPLLYKNLRSILDIDDASVLNLYMCVNNRNGSEMDYIDLVKDGCEHQVTNSNRNQYVQQYAKWYLEIRVEKQIRAMCQELWKLVPIKYLQVFTVHELEYLIAGSPTIDVADWMRHTVYHHPYHEDHRVIRNFWKCVASFDHWKRSRLLQFITGSTRVPISGFNRMISILDRPISNPFPSASTCYYRLKLPPYPDYKIMYQRLEILVTHPDVFQFGRG